MRKIWTVARTEYLNAVRSKAFIIGIIMLPVMMSGSLVIGALTRNKVDIRPRKLAVVDQTGWLAEVIERRAAERNAKDIFDPANKTKQIRPAFIIEAVTAKSAEDKLEMTLSDRVRKKDLFAFLVLRPDTADPAATNPVSYYTETASFEDLPRWLNRVLTDEITRKRFEEAGVDQKVVTKLTTPIYVRQLGLTEVDTSGQVIKAKETNRAATFLIPFASMMMMFMLVMSSAPALLNSVLEEKMQKIAEVLISSVTPFELMTGKLIGTVMVSLTLSVLYVGGALLLLTHFAMTGYLNPALFVWFIVFQLLGLLIFGSIFIAIGSACNEIRDAQSLMSPAMMMIVLPMFCIMPVLESPSSSFSRAVSLFPPATPMLMTLRIASKPGPPLWEILLGVVLCAAFTVFCLWAAAKVFRIGILSQGQAPTFGKLIKWIFSK
jgi:ABC-2 type transport system permease protein